MEKRWPKLAKYCSSMLGESVGEENHNFALVIDDAVNFFKSKNDIECAIISLVNNDRLSSLDSVWYKDKQVCYSLSAELELD